MFGPPGHLYVYFTYGMHFCCNVVCETDGIPGAVLLRAVEPLEGLDLMVERRGLERTRDLARGPARLCQAFGIDRRHNGTDLVGGEIWLEPRRRLKGEILTSKRIGLTAGLDQPWRFYEEGIWISSLAPSRL
jgi:DNA-3-methyladenine glycosylase